MYASGLALAASVVAGTAGTCRSWSGWREKRVSVGGAGSGGEGEISGGGYGERGAGRKLGLSFFVLSYSHEAYLDYGGVHF